MKCKSPDELFFLRLSDFVIAKHKQTMLAVLLVNSNHANAVWKLLVNKKLKTNHQPWKLKKAKHLIYGLNYPNQYSLKYGCVVSGQNHTGRAVALCFEHSSDSPWPSACSLASVIKPRPFSCRPHCSCIHSCVSLFKFSQQCHIWYWSVPSSRPTDLSTSWSLQIICTGSPKKSQLNLLTTPFDWEPMCTLMLWLKSGWMLGTGEKCLPADHCCLGVHVRGWIYLESDRSISSGFLISTLVWEGH